jgi:HD-GYP domain-containing protein (c-di-GMP phosphodiesterase class II)/DNA-binding CsgD family transcriptional regulator
MSSLRLAEVLAGLSLVTDLGMAHPPDEALRTCLLATRLARELGLTEDEVRETYYASLLQHVGCTAAAHELSLAFGDDVAANRAGARTDFSRAFDVFATWVPEFTAGRPRSARVEATAAVLVRGRRLGGVVARADCEVATATARRLGLPDGVQRALGQMFEWWNGKGAPRRLRGGDIAAPTRLVHVASHAALFAGLGGAELASAVVRRRSGRYLDPAIAETFTRRSDALLAELEVDDLLVAVLQAEPEPTLAVTPTRLDDVARAFGDVVDLKSPFLHGHSSRVGELAHGAAEALGLGDRAAADVRRAGFLHDLGRAAVPTSVWEKPGPLSALEWEQVRLHAYNTERVLARSESLSGLAPIAGMHHERQDGSGYHRGVSGRSVSPAARALAAADVYVALTEKRPHRPALEPEPAAAVIRSEVRAGRLDADAADAVIVATGLRRPKRRALPADLSTREVEVLRLVAEGLTNREIARRLVVSPRTAEHHVQHAYRKIGVSSRAAAALFALEHGLLE